MADSRGKVMSAYTKTKTANALAQMGAAMEVDQLVTEFDRSPDVGVMEETFENYSIGQAPTSTPGAGKRLRTDSALSATQTEEDNVVDEDDIDHCLLDLVTGYDQQEAVDDLQRLTYAETPADDDSTSDSDVTDHDQSDSSSSNGIFSDESEPSYTNLPKEEQVRLTTLAFHLKHNLAKSTLSDELDLLNVATDSSLGKEMRSPYLFLKRYDHLLQNIKRITICSKCPALLKNGENGKPTEQQECGHEYNRYSGCCYTLLLPVENQIKFFLENHGTKPTDLPTDPDLIGDVNTGQEYKKIKEKFDQKSERFLTLQLNMDGARFFKKSQYGFWPFMAILCEAGYKIRRSNVILFALWYGCMKPPGYAFLEPCTDVLHQLVLTGIVFRGIKYNILPIILTCDTIARPLFSNTSQFNGECGCIFCLHTGYMMSKGRGHVRVYCERDPDGNLRKYPLRSLEQHAHDLKELSKLKTKNARVNGIKGPTPLMDIPDFDFLKAFVPDYLHAVCHGVLKYFMLLFSSKAAGNSDKPWCIAKKMKRINNRFAKTMPPSDVTRTPQTFDSIPDMKASDFKSFGLYYYPILEGILPEPYFTHFACLSLAIYALLQDNVSRETVIAVGRLLNHLVLQVEDLYGREHVTYNMHLLTHLAQCVLDWGCLWSSSNFIPEGFIGELQKMAKGTQSVVDQMAKQFLFRNALRQEVITLLKDPTIKVPDSTVDLLKKLLLLPASLFDYQSSVGHCFISESKVGLMGIPERKQMTQEQQMALINLILRSKELASRFPDIAENCTLPSTYAMFYPRMKCKSGSVFTTTSYERATKRIDYCCSLEDQEFFLIESIAKVESLQNFCFVSGFKMGSITKHNFAPMSLDDGLVPVPLVSGQTVELTGTEQQLTAYQVQDVKRKCVVAVQNKIIDTYVVTAVANTVETD